MKIYLATPYSDPDPDVMAARFDAVTKEAGALMQHGHLVYSLITSCHPVAMRCDLPRGWDFWREMDTSFIEWADEVWVLRVPGWSTSQGVNAEMDIAEKLGKPVRFIGDMEAT